MAKPLGPQPGDDRATWWLALCYLAAYVALDWASYIRPLQGLNITPWNPQPALAIMMLILSWRDKRASMPIADCRLGWSAMSRSS